MGLIVGSIMVPITSVKMRGMNDDKGKDYNYLGSGGFSPEKAGVGGFQLRPWPPCFLVT
jgi:hypothetical protein